MVESATRYADLLIRFGVRLKKGQTLLLELPQEHAPFAEVIKTAAFAAGADDVAVFYNDIHAELARLKLCAEAGSMPVPPWRAAAMRTCLERNGVSLSLMSPYPAAMLRLSVRERQIWAAYQNDLRNIVRSAIRTDRIQWCYACVPNREWAAQVYPELPEEAALRQMWSDMMELCLICEDCDPVEAWFSTYEGICARAERLTALPLHQVHLTTELGTDITIGLHQRCIWEGGLSRGDYERGAFQPNIPSYEICTTTDRAVAEGTVVASYPVNYNGSVISDIRLTFREGRVCDYAATEGKDTLRRIIEHDEGSSRLGEIAFLECDLPIARLGRLFYNTLLDENAACHLALGMGFPGNIDGIDPRDMAAARACGVNFSDCHVDFMFGTPDTSADGICADGRVIPIMRKGKFVL